MKSHVLSENRPELYVAAPDSKSPVAKLETIHRLTAVDFLHHLPDIAWVADEDGHLLNANAAFYRHFKLDSSKSANMLFTSLVPPEISSKLCVYHRNVFTKGKALKTDIMITQPGENSLVYHLNIFPLPPAGARRILAGIATTSRVAPVPAVKKTAVAAVNNIPSVDVINKALHAERTRIGHELHDNVNQILSSAALYIDSLKPVNDHQTLIKTKGREYIMLAIEEIRNLSRRMVMPYLDNKTLSEKINGLVQDVRTTTTLQLTYSPSFPADELSACKKLTLFRIIQEQVKNILTHSKAKSAEIRLAKSGDQVLLEIADNGVGFDPKRMSRGIGLSGIISRVSEVKGKVSIDADPGRGCTLSASIPV